MSNKNQSSIEWLYEQLTLTWYDYNSGKDLLEQAKAMHKEEIIKFAEDWGKSNLDCKEDLYTDTFNSDEG